MFIERYAEGTTRPSTRKPAWALLYYHTHTLTHRHTDTRAYTDTQSEGRKGGRLSEDKHTSLIAVPLIQGHAKRKVTGHI